MADKGNTKNTSSESLIAILVVLVLAGLLGYYIYLEETQVDRIPERSFPIKRTVSMQGPPRYHMPSSYQALLPVSNSGNQVIHRFAYSLSYDEAAEQAEWLAYMLTDEHLHGKERRSNVFKEDPLIETGSASNKDYHRSGFDKGHLAPAADFRWNTQAMEESFYLSNISPQQPGFNRGVWKELEEKIREWASYEETLYIVTGALLHPELPVIGENKVAVPEEFYKVVLDASRPEYKGIAFIIKNERAKEPLHTFAVSIDSVEALTGIDFFPALPDELENEIENHANFFEWPLIE